MTARFRPNRKIRTGFFQLDRKALSMVFCDSSQKQKAQLITVNGMQKVSLYGCRHHPDRPRRIHQSRRTILATESLRYRLATAYIPIAQTSTTRTEITRITSNSASRLVTKGRAL